MFDHHLLNVKPFPEDGELFMDAGILILTVH